jgi:aconitate hydratase
MNTDKLNLNFEDQFDIRNISQLEPRGEVELVIIRKDGSTRKIPLLVRIDTESELDFYKNNGILTYVLRQVLK